MNFCRSIYRRWIVTKRKFERKNEKNLRKSCVHNLLTSSLQKILLSAAGITLLTQPLFGGSQSTITRIGNKTTISYDETKKTHTITTSAIKGKNAFNAFKEFTLSSGEIANLKFPENTNNLLNFVKNKIDIKGTLNAVKNSKIGGNLYFLSSEGFILSKGGVINAGAFYAMTPTKDFMEKFIPTDNTLNLNGVDSEISYIVDRKISDYNSAYSYGVNINPLGEITIEGKINTINGIGLYAGGKDSGDTTKQGLVIKNDAQLRTIAKDELSLFVNLDGINLPEADDIVTKDGNIELVSVQNNTHHTSSIGKYATGYSSFSAASASANIEMNGTIISRNEAKLISYASNGKVDWITAEGKRSFDKGSKVSDVYSSVTVGGSIKGKNGITVKALSESNIQLDKMNVTSMLLELGGQAFFPFPLNIDANVVVSNTNSNVDIKKTGYLESNNSISVNSITKSTSIAGADTSLIVLEKAADSKFNWLPEVSSTVVISEASSKVDFNGTAFSYLDKNDKNGTKAISVLSQSDNTLQSTSTAVSMDSHSALDAAITVGKFSNKALLNIGKNARLETPQMVEVSAIANNKNSISSKTSIGNTAYAAPAVSVSIFDSEATTNYDGDFSSNIQVGSFTFKVINNILSDKLNASSGIAPMSPLDEEYHRIVKKTLEGIYSKFKINTTLGGLLPDEKLAKFSVAGAIAYGGGKHSATLNFKPGSKLVTTGDLILKVGLNVEDTKYNVSSKAKAKAENQNGAKVETALSLLVTDYEYKSDIIFDDSLTNPKTKISGKSIVAESMVYQPYQRPQKMIEELLKAWDKLIGYFTKPEHQEACAKVKAAFKKLGDTNAKVDDYGFINTTSAIFTDLIDGFNSLYEFAKLEGFVLEDGLVPRVFNFIYDVLAFKEYSNYVNNSVSSSVSTSKEGDSTVDFSGSVFVGNNSGSSNILIGKNVTLNSLSSNIASSGITLKATSDITNTTMVGGLPVLYANNSGTKSIGGSVIVHLNNSEANVLAASGANIGNNNLKSVNIDTVNIFTPIDIIVGTTSTQNGFNAMASAIDGKSHSNIRIDEGTNLAADTIKLNAYNNTNADNIVGALTLSEKVGIGVGLGITLLDKETQVLVQDNDEYWQKLRKEYGLRSDEPKSSEYIHEVATITADVFKAVAKTTGTINTIGVAGCVEVDDKTKYDKFSGNVGKINGYASKGYLDKSTVKYKIISKIMGIDLTKPNVPAPPAQPPRQIETPSLSLTANGSAAANAVKNTTKVTINQANFDFKGKTNRKLEASAINSSHNLAFAGAAGLMAKGKAGNGKAVGVAGTVAVNNLTNNTETLIKDTVINEAKQINALTINGGEAISTGLGLQVMAASPDPEQSGGGTVNASINLIDNNITSKVDNLTNKTSGSNKTNMVITAYESDTQVTGGVSAAVGKQKGAVGVSLDIAEIDNNLTSEIANSNLANMNNVEVNALQASTIVNAGIAAAVAAGTDNSGVFSGSGVYSELTSNNSANINKSKINSETLSVRTQDVRTTESYEANLERNGSNVDFIDKDGKSFYTGLETASGTTELGTVASGRKGSLLVTASVSGAYSDTAVGLGAAINEIDNSFNVNVSDSNITSTKFNADAVSHTDAITIGVGAAISTDEEKGSGIGSAAWNSIKNKANVKFSNNTIKSDTFNLKSLNDSTLVGVAGAVAVSTGKGGVGASVEYNAIDNTAISELYGGTVTGISSATSELNVNAENDSNIWGVAVTVGVSKKVAVSGNLVINEIDNNSVAKVGSLTTNLKTNIKELKSFNILATDSADIRSLSGAVTGSKEIAVGGAVAVNQVGGETLVGLENTTFKSNTTKLKAYSDSDILSMAIGAGGSGKVAVQGASVANTITRDVKSNVNNAITDNTSSDFNAYAESVGKTGALSIVGGGAKNVAVGAGISVNRIGGKVSSDIASSSFKLKSLYSEANSNKRISNIGVGGSGSGDGAVDGSIVYNGIDGDTTSTISKSTIVAENNISVVAKSDDTLNNYSGQAQGSGKIAAGVSISINNISGDTTAKVDESNITAKGNDSSETVAINNVIEDSEINNKYASVSTINIDYSLHDQRKNATATTGLQVDSSSTHTLKSFVASISGAGAGAGNANINVNIIDGNTNSSLENSLLNKGLNGTTAGNVSVKASDYSNTAGFIGSIAIGGKAGLGASFDTNKVNRNTKALISKAKAGSVTKDTQVKANSKQGISSVVAGIAGGGYAAVAGNVSIGLNNGKTIAEVSDSKMSVNSLDVEANHYARAHTLAGTGAIGIMAAGVGASVVVNNDINTVSAIIGSSTIGINKNSGGAIKVNALNDDNFEAASAAVGGGQYAGVAGAVIVNYLDNKVDSGIATSTIGTSSNRADNIEIKSKDVSRLEADGGTIAGGIGALGASVFVNTYDGHTNTNIFNSKIYSKNNVDLGAYEERNGSQYAVGVTGGVGAIGSNILVINSGKKLDVKESGSNDANTDLNAALGMADKAVSKDYITSNNRGALTDEELTKIFDGKPTYTASKDGNAVTLTKIDKSVIDSTDGKITSNTLATGTIKLSNYGGAGGVGGILGGFGFIYDNKNVITSVLNSNINAGNGIDIRSITGGISNMEMIQASAGVGDYCGAFAYVKLAGNTSVGIAGSRLDNKKDAINIVALDEASGKNDAKGYTFGGLSVGTIISKAKNNSTSDVTISNSRVANNGSYTASNTINISSEKNNSLSAIGYSGTASAVDVIVVSTLAQDEGKSVLKLGAGNYFEAKELNALASNRPDLYSKLFSWSAGVLVGVGVGDVTTREYGTAKFNAVAGSKYNVNTINMGAKMDSQSSQISEAYTVTVGADIHVNKADTLSSSNVEVDVNIGKDDYSKNTILNVYGENNASATMDVYGVSVGGILSVANNEANAIASLTTKVNVNAAAGSNLSQINAHSSSLAYHKLHANGDGGGLISISPYAASTDSKMVLTTNTNLSKNLTADKISADAIGTTKGYLTSDAIQGELVGGCGTQVSYDYDLNTKVNVSDNAQLTAKIVNLKTQNNIVTGAERDEKNIKTKSYGFDTGARVDNDQIIKSTSQVNIGKNVNILATEKINIDAKTKADLFNKVHAGGAGFGSHLGSHVYNEFTVNNNIYTEEGSLLKTDKPYADVNLATSYNIIATSSAYTEVEGAGAGNTFAEVTNVFKINDNINLKGDIYSYNDINLYTDKDTDEIISELRVDNEAEGYTRAIIPWETKADIDNDIKRNNSITVNSNSDLKSVRHTTYSTRDSFFDLKNHTVEYNWYNQDEDGKTTEVSTVSEGTSKGGLTETDSIKVDGKSVAGIHNKINVTIDGKVAFDTNVTGDGIVRQPTIDCNTDEYKNSFTYGTMDYANELFTRYQEVEKLCSEYAGTIVGANYQAEKNRLLTEMEKYGLYDRNKKEVIGKLNVEYIELPDMVCSGGNIYLNIKKGSNVTGSGQIKAQGAPQIKVDNNSNLYMKVNDLTVVEPGGEIFLGEQSLGETAQTVLSVSKAEADDPGDSLIEVNEKWKNRYDVNYTYIDPKDNKKKTESVTFTPLTNIEINGHITNEYGNIVFYNANKDIVLQGKTAKDSASINGYHISISAPNGSIAQGYTQGITNIGYTPEAVLKSYANSQESAIIKGLDLGQFAGEKYKSDSLTQADIEKYLKLNTLTPTGANDSASGVWLAGGSVYLNGDDINVNGTIQSGYSQFTVELTDSAKTRIQAIKDNYNKSGKPQITQSYLEQNCQINDSGMNWNSNSGTYDYVVQAYYNPQTDCIVLEDVQSNGGQIYITGRISNTSGGKIYAADGSSDITIKNQTGYKLVANTLDVGDRKGIIKIMDLGNNKDANGKVITDGDGTPILGKLTEMTSDSTKVWYLYAKGQTDTPQESSGLSTVYNPQKGLTYNWSTGFEKTFFYRYEESYDTALWGAIDYNEKCSEKLDEKVKDGSIDPISTGARDKLTGTYIGTPDKVDASNGYFIDFQNFVNYSSKTSGGHKEYNDFLHFSATYYSWSEYKFGSTGVYQHSIKADYPISIGFIKGNGNINLTTNSDLVLQSDIISKYGEIKLKSENGSIEQIGGNIYADNIYLNATSGIGAKNAITQKMQSNSGVFSAITTSGDVNLVSKNRAGVKDAKLKISAVTDKGNASVITDASMLQSGNAVDVKGSRIDLVSTYGSIGKKDALLKINAGQEIVKPGDTLSASVNAKAYGDVALNQTSGDMRIGKIISNYGDAYMTSAGSVIDALPPNAETKDNQEVERLIAKWKDLGIISESGKNNSAEKKQEAITAYKNSVYTAYARYKGLKERFDKDKKDTTSDTYKEYQKLKERFGGYSSADKWLEAQNKDKNSQWYKIQNEVAYGWTQDALLYAIQDSIINRETGSTVTPKSASDANIKARNITINAGGGIGRNDGYTVVDISDLQSAKGLEALKAIAAAEASDVKWGYDGDNVDENKATINKVNSIAIDASGKLEASAKGNIYLEDVNKNAVKLISVKSQDGNIRVYGSKGIYNATSYKEGDANNIINLAGKDLILESGEGSIGTKDVPVTTDMSGAITARSSYLINLYQIGKNAMTFAAVYSGATLNIRALNNILSVYNKSQAEELGYLHAKDNITLYSDQGDIGQSGGKGLRVKLEKGKLVNAEAESVYLKGYGDSALNLGKITARSGNVGIDSGNLDLILNDDIKAQNLEFRVKSLNQKKGKLDVAKLLSVTANNGITLGNFQNLVAEASLINNKSGDIILCNNRDLILYDVINKAPEGNLSIITEGSLTAKNGLSSDGNLFIWSDGDIDIQKDTNSNSWMGLYADNGGVKTTNLTARYLDISADKNGITLGNVESENYIDAQVLEGDIVTGDLLSGEGSINVITNAGNIKSKTITAKEDVSVVAYKDQNNGGDLSVDTINSHEGDIEAVGYNSLTANIICASNNFFVGSLGDVKVNSLLSKDYKYLIVSDIFDDLNIKGNTSYLKGKNVDIDIISVQKSFEAVASGKFRSNNIKIGKYGTIAANNDVDINQINSGKDLFISSNNEGFVKIRNTATEDGELVISNRKGLIELENVDAGGDVHINNFQEGNIDITDSLVTRNGGSLYSNIKNGDFRIKSGKIEGEASIYSDEGDVLLTNINFGKELDVRAKNGIIAVMDETSIGGDATLKSDSKSVFMVKANVDGNMKMSAQTFARISEANVGGSMLMKGLESGCEADYLTVGKDLIINTYTGSIDVEEAKVGGNSYLSISENGGDISIQNIQTGKDLKGDLIINSNSEETNNKHPKITIKKAVAANKLIINSMSDIDLTKVFALNGRLEVKAAGDVVAQYIEAAKDLYIATLEGIIKIEKILAGDNISISNFMGKMVISDIATRNPDADIEIFQGFGDITVNNATSTKDLKIYNINGDVTLDKISTGGNIDVSSGLLLTKGANISINNSYAAKDINLKGGKGNVDLTNTSVGNNLSVYLDGIMNLKDVNVGNNSKITSYNDSEISIEKLKTNSFDLKDEGQTEAIITNSELGKANIDISGAFDLTKSSSDDMTAILNGKSNISESEFGKADITNNSELVIKDSNGNSIKTTNNNNLTVTKDSFENFNLINNSNALIEDSTINSMTADNNAKGMLELTNKLTINDLSLTNKGNALIHDSTVNKMNSSNEGYFELTNAPVESLDLTNKKNGTTLIHDTKVTSMTSSNEGYLELTSAPVENLDLTNKKNGNALIQDTTVTSMISANTGSLDLSNASVENLDLTNKTNGKAIIHDNTTINSMTSSNDGSLEITNAPIKNLNLTNESNGNAFIHDTTVTSMTSSNDGTLEITRTKAPIKNLNLTNNAKGNASIHDTAITSLTASNNGELNVKNINGEKAELANGANAYIEDSKITKGLLLNNKGTANIFNSEIKDINANNDGQLNGKNITSEKLVLKSEGNADIEDSKIDSINAQIGGVANINKVESGSITFDVSGKSNIKDSTINKFTLTNSGDTTITDNKALKTLTANNSGKLNVNNSPVTTMSLTNSGNTNIEESSIINLSANSSGSLTVKNGSVATMNATNSGKSLLDNVDTSKITFTNTGNADFKEVKFNGYNYIRNNSGTMTIAKLNAANNFDLNSSGGSINMSGIEVKNDFNFALAGNSGIKFDDITIDHDFNVYAAKAELKGNTLNIGNDFRTLTYSKYSAPKANLRAAVSKNSGTARASKADEGFTLILDQLSIKGGLYVDNPDVTIIVNDSKVGKNVDIDAGKENIQIDKLDVDGGSLDIKGNSGSVKLGEVKVENDTIINLGSGNLDVKDLTSNREIDFKVGGSITSDTNIETKNGSVNMVAGSGVNAYKILANQQGNIEAVNGDIIIGQIDGKTLVFKEDTNDRTLKIGEANVLSKITAGADYIDIDLINQKGDEEKLGIDFTLVNGKAMDNVVIRDVQNAKRVDMYNLVSMYGNIHVSNEIFNLNKTYLLKMGDLSNTVLKFRLFGDNPTYSSDPQIIAFFSPKVNHKNFANISFTNEGLPGKQDYIPLTAKGDFKRMFNQYTVVQEIQALHLAYEDRIDDLSDDYYTNFDYRKLDNSKTFYVNPDSDIYTDGDSINLDDVDIPVGIEFDSASGELKPIGSHIKPHPAVD